MILTTISLGIYIVYNIISICKLKDFPKCLSETFYLFPKWVFPLVMTLIGLTILPVWIELSEGSNFQFLSFLTCVTIILVGFAPDYKDNSEYTIHSICACIACIASIISIIVVMETLNVLITILIVTFLTMFMLQGLKETKRIWLYLLEHVMFLSIFMSIFYKL